MVKSRLNNSMFTFTHIFLFILMLPVSYIFIINILFIPSGSIINSLVAAGSVNIIIFYFSYSCGIIKH